MRGAGLSPFDLIWGGGSLDDAHGCSVLTFENQSRPPCDLFCFCILLPQEPQASLGVYLSRAKASLDPVSQYSIPTVLPASLHLQGCKDEVKACLRKTLTAAHPQGRRGKYFGTSYVFVCPVSDSMRPRPTQGEHSPFVALSYYLLRCSPAQAAFPHKTTDLVSHVSLTT